RARGVARPIELRRGGKAAEAVEGDRPSGSWGLKARAAPARGLRREGPQKRPVCARMHAWHLHACMDAFSERERSAARRGVPETSGPPPEGGGPKGGGPTAEAGRRSPSVPLE